LLFEYSENGEVLIVGETDTLEEKFIYIVKCEELTVFLLIGWCDLSNYK